MASPSPADAAALPFALVITARGGTLVIAVPLPALPAYVLLHLLP